MAEDDEEKRVHMIEHTAEFMGQHLRGELPVIALVGMSADGVRCLVSVTNNATEDVFCKRAEAFAAFGQLLCEAYERVVSKPTDMRN